MFVWTKTSFDSHNSEYGFDRLERDTCGMIAGTKVATQSGWRPVEAIAAGDQVLTFDGGLQKVQAVTRRTLATNPQDAASWPLSVPAGALGNREKMQILPSQAVMIESDLAESMFDDPFALIPAQTLEGMGNIWRSRPDCDIEVIELHFERDEIVFANIGALFLCRAKVDLLAAPSQTDYAVMEDGNAQMLVAQLFGATPKAMEIDLRLDEHAA